MFDNDTETSYAEAAATLNERSALDAAGSADPSPEAIQFHVLSFEGPDAYAQAGGIASRVTGLTRALADGGYQTHLWFVGDPDGTPHERRGCLRLHRWCQWISRYHGGGVYDGEEGKRDDYARSLPPFLFGEFLRPHLDNPGAHAVVLAEEWHTADAVLHLDWLLRRAGRRQQVTILWNANNSFGFDRIAWDRLARAAVITTVSRYMKHRMWALGVNPLVIPNGLSIDALIPPLRAAVIALRHRFRGRALLTKVARWDPDKRWLLTIDTVGELKRDGWRPLLVARGGVEAHGAEVFQRAAARGLRVAELRARGHGVAGVLRALLGVRADLADVLVLHSSIDPDSRRVLFRASDAVLANSGHEPFGLVGLETMAAGGVACTGCSGEDYAVAGRNALVLETADPREFVMLYRDLRADPAKDRALRRAGRSTARQFTWPAIMQRALLPRVRMLAGRPVVTATGRAVPSAGCS